jgi:hypothetical protein
MVSPSMTWSTTAAPLAAVPDAIGKSGNDSGTDDAVMLEPVPSPAVGPVAASKVLAGETGL